MALAIAITVLTVFFLLAFIAWRRYLWAAEQVPQGQADTCPYSLTDVFGDRYLVNAPHQKDVQWLNDVYTDTQLTCLYC